MYLILISIIIFFWSFITAYEINIDCININITEKSKWFLIWEVENWEKHYVTTYLSWHTLYVYDRSYHWNQDITKEEYKTLYPKMNNETNVIFALYTFTIQKYLSFNSIIK